MPPTAKELHRSGRSRGLCGIGYPIENTFIGAYLTAVKEFGSMAGNATPFTSTQMDNNGQPYTAAQLVNFAEVAASIMGVEAEHRNPNRHRRSADVIQ
jgi:hypothetical protein